MIAILAACLIAIVSALAVVIARRPIYSAIGLLAHSLSLAALFALLAADLVAVGQLLIYSGAIVVLFLFVVTLLPLGGSELPPTPNRVASALVAAAALLAALAAALAGVVPVAGPDTSGLTIQYVGEALFGPVLVAFELTAPLLLVAIVGADVVWRRHEPATRGPVRR